MEAHEQGLGIARSPGLAPNSLPTIINALPTISAATNPSLILVSEQGQEIEQPQSQGPDDDWTDVFTLLCGGEDDGHGLA